MNLKAVILIIILAVLFQVIFFGLNERDNIAEIEKATLDLKNRAGRLQADKTGLNKEYKRLTHIVESIPPRFLTGFEDPEVSLFEFLDSLPAIVSSDEARGVSSSVTFGRPVFKSSPIPLHETDVTFKYRFSDTYEAENFFNYLLYQKKWPLMVKDMTAQKAEQGVVAGRVSVALLIPAKLQLPPVMSKSTESK